MRRVLQVLGLSGCVRDGLRCRLTPSPRNPTDADATNTTPPNEPQSGRAAGARCARQHPPLTRPPPPSPAAPSPNSATLSDERIFPRRLRREQPEGPHDLLPARPPGRAALQVQARQRVRGLVRDALHDGDLRGRRRRRSRPCTSCRPSSYRRPTLAIRRTGVTSSDSVRPGPARRWPSPISTPTSRGFPGCTAGRPGPAPATTSAKSIYISDFFYWNPSGVGAGIEDITSVATCGSATRAFAVDGQPSGLAAVAGANRLRRPKRLAASRDQALRRAVSSSSGSSTSRTSATTRMPTAIPSPMADGASPCQYVQKLLGGDNKLVVPVRHEAAGPASERWRAFTTPTSRSARTRASHGCAVRRRAHHSAHRVARRAGGAGLPA